MRTNIQKAIVTATILLSLFFSAVSQQVAKSIPYPASPDGLIGFLQFTPPDYGSQQHPLIIFLHGIGERGNGTSQINSVANNGTPYYCSKGATMRFTVGGQTSSFVVLSPQLSSQYGYWPTYYVKEMINYAKANLKIDPNRIYVTGLSLGGGGIWRLITDTYNYDHTFDASIAAAAPVCGTQEETDADFCSTIGANHLPVWAFHCMDDGTVGVGATQHAEILANMCGISPAAKFTYYQSGGHAGAWINAYDTGHITRTVNGGGSFTANPNLYEWFLSNTRSGAATAPVNTAPTANAGSAQSITLPTTTATLAGSGAGTNGASISSYSWAKTSGPAGGTISNAASASTAVTGLTQGSYVYTLTVTDNHGLTANSSVNVTVNAAAPVNTVPTANAGGAQSITLPSSSVTLSGSGAGTNGATISSYSWAKTSGPAGGTISNAASASTSVTGLTQGSYVFTLKVTDNHGLSSSSTVNVTVNPPANQPPVSNAGSNINITLPTNSTTLNGTASRDADGTISTYSWTKTSGPTSYTIANSGAASTGLSNLVQGTYVFSLQVTDNAGATASSAVTVTVNGATVAAAPAAVPLGYLKQSVGIYQACDDASTAGRFPVYGSGVSNGNKFYLDAQLTQIYNGGYNWFSFTATLGGTVTQALAVFPDGVIHMMNNCAGGATPTPTPAPAAPTNGALLGYIKISVGPYQACDDASTTGRIPLYGTSIANGAVVYSDAAMTQKYDGGWNWFSFTPAVGGKTTYAFAIYPIGTIGLLRNCATGTAVRIAASTTAEQDIATLKSMKDSANGLTPVLTMAKLSIYPNPVHSSATIQLNSANNTAKTINVYNSSGVLLAKYTWQTVQGNNLYSLKDVSKLSNGLYIVDIRDNKGKSVGSVKFLKM